ncbi:MAG: polyhydroxyalkanoic acid system family protein [Nannocystaceae bacterium]
MTPASRPTFASRANVLAASGEWPAFTWLDGADQSESWLGLECDEEIRGESLGLVDEIAARWRADPRYAWAGWITYGVGAAALMGRRATIGKLPGICMRRFRAMARFDARARFDPDGMSASSTAFVGDAGAAADLVRRLQQAEAPLGPPPGWPLASLRARVDAGAYRRAVGRALEHIGAGDTYQVNLSQAFDARWKQGCSPSAAQRVAALYGHLRAKTPARMGALVAAGDHWIVSNSPETLLKIDLGADGIDQATSFPIKGTRSRGADAEADERAAADLVASEKDRAEHMMIVDLVRNDLGRVARPGSVHVSRQLQPMTLPTVHHLVSEVGCHLRVGWRLGDIVRSVFPGGSVTGAPKRRTLEIIDDLEGGESREIYCGALLLLAPQGVQMSILIRTALASPQGVWLRSGGGIVYDSDPEAERLETVAKMRAFDPQPHRDVPSRVVVCSGTPVKHDIPHDLDASLARIAAQKAVDSYRGRFAQYNFSERWVDDTTMAFDFAVAGTKLEGSLGIRERHYELDLQVPFVFKVFRGKAISIIEREVNKWVAKAKNGDLG